MKIVAPGDRTDAQRTGKRAYKSPAEDAAPFVKVWQRGEDALPVGKIFSMPAIKEFFKKISDVACLKYQDFQDYIRLSRSVKY